MTTAAAILYREAQPFERALAEALSDELPIPIRDILDPTKTPAAFLPFLAAGESVDLWFDDWPDARKRLMIVRAKLGIGKLKGGRGALDAFLPFVDAAIVDKVSHPRRFVVGFAAVGVTPIGHKPFTTHILVNVPLQFPAGAFLVDQSAVGLAALRTFDREPLRRVRRAVQVAKSEDTQITINHGHRRFRTLDDGFPLDGFFRFGDFTDRKRL